MKVITFKGYAGNGESQAEDNKAMGLTVGKKYEVIGRWDCGDGCTKKSPTVLNDLGIPQDVCHDECEGD